MDTTYEARRAMTDHVRRRLRATCPTTPAWLTSTPPEAPPSLRRWENLSITAGAVLHDVDLAVHLICAASSSDRESFEDLLSVFLERVPARPQRRAVLDRALAALADSAGSGWQAFEPWAHAIADKLVAA